MHPVETYIRDLSDIRRSGEAVKETSYYPPLSNLLNEVGKMLKPHVRCIINIKNRGAGIPDGGLFTADQLRNDADNVPFISQLPARGAIEVKGTSEDILKLASSQQVSRYLEKYGQVLITNYHDFILMGRDKDGKSVKLEAYSLAENESAFWKVANNPRKMAVEYGESFVEYLKRVILHAAPLTAPGDVAQFLASYARDARLRIEKASLPALDAIRTTLEQALGLSFDTKKGEHFFRSTLVQTIFYGVFSAWVLWSKQHEPNGQQSENFSWKEAIWYLHVPMIRALFEQVATPTKLGPLGFVELLNWTGTVLNRVDRSVFFSKFEEDHAVQYFYEPFLQAFDPELRKDLGVWYTPPEIVQYMVARVDKVLREELDIEDGLADPSVYILDPCCGTGAYLVEVLKHIATTLREKGMDALSMYDIKKAAMERVFGFEILPAPFVVAHLQLGLLLQNLGVPLSDEKRERAGVYLTNALTGWEPPDPAKEKVTQLQLAGIPELKEEKDAAEQIKRKVPILVIIGNPPYNAFAGVSPKEEQQMVEIYKEGLISKWGIKKFNLDDLYVRFFRLAERRIAEKTKRGVVCYISNNSWVSDPSFVVLRQHLLTSFDRFWIENMHGDRTITEYAPDGRTSETIFAIPGFSAGIRQGVAISLWVKNNKNYGDGKILFRDDLNAAKAVERRAQLLATLDSKNLDAFYVEAEPDKMNRFSFKPSQVDSDYEEWPLLTELCKEPPIHGPVERRAGALIDIDKTLLESRMRAYFDPSLGFSEITNICYGLTREASGFNPKKARETALKLEGFDPNKIKKYLVRPFDSQWCYYTLAPTIWSRPSRQIFEQCWQGNAFIGSRPTGASEPEGPPLLYSTILPDYQTMIRNISYFPINLKSALKRTVTKEGVQSDFLDELEVSVVAVTANLSSEVRTYLAKIGLSKSDIDRSSDLIWMNTLAICYSPAYIAENANGISQDWPRIPLPSSKDLLCTSAEVGRKLAELLNTQSSVMGVTSGKIRLELRSIANISHISGGPINPDNGDLSVTASWGYSSKGNITMPGQGRLINRKYTSEELFQIDAGAREFDLSSEQVVNLLGQTTNDVYLNDSVYWENIPTNVWEYVIGGYQIIKKWLSYREFELLERSLSIEEVREVSNIARRIAAILLMGPDLDTNFLQVAHSTYLWPKSQSEEG